MFDNSSPYLQVADIDRDFKPTSDNNHYVNFDPKNKQKSRDNKGLYTIIHPSNTRSRRWMGKPGGRQVTRRAT